jgi:hypothetical protein
VRRDLGRAARLLVLPTLALLYIAAFLPGRLGITTRIYALVVCAIALGVAFNALRRAYPAATPLRRPARSSERSRRPPPSLARLEHLTALGAAGAFDFHHRLRPRLRSAALGLLSTRRRVSLDDDPDAARRLLGDEAYELVRADRPPPVDRLARGTPISELRRVVESLERL